MSLSDALASSVTGTIRGRGRDYFRSGAVRLGSVDRTGASATVRGSERYAVHLALDGRVVRASCTCPYVDEYGDICKHIWATVLAAEPRGFAADAAADAAAAGRLRLVLEADDEYDEGYDDEDEGFEEEDEEYDHPRRYSPPVRPAPAPAPKRESWKDLLAAVGRDALPAAPAVDQRLLFVVDRPASKQADKLVLEVVAQDRLAGGGWGKPRTYYPPTARLDLVADPLDRQIVALLGGPERGDGYGYSYGYGYSSGGTRYRLAGPLLDAVLPLLAGTGRVRLRRDPHAPADLDDLAPDLDPSWELVVAVARGADGQWVLTAGLRRGDESLPLTGPALTVPGAVIWDGRFGRLADAGGFGWLQALRRAGAVAVPAAEAGDLVGQLLRLPRLPRLELPEELRYTEEAVPPRPRLVVKKPQQQYGPSVLHADLSFGYDGEVVPARPSGRGVYQPDRRRFLVRDPAAERAAGGELLRLGVRPGRSGGPAFELKPALLPTLARELVAAGWAVEAEGRLYRPAGRFELAVRSDRDWFDLNGAADFDGRGVPFPRLLEALRKGESTVALDDGSVGLLPEDWLQKYGLLARMGTIEGDAARFSRAQVGVLDALLSARPEVTFDRAFARARDELRKFAGIAPADPPAAFKGELREYQREGLGWLRFLRKFGFGGCLADDMGLGKTVQVLALLAGRRGGPALVVVPKSLVFNWKQEAARFAPKLKVLDHTGTARDRSGAAFGDYDLVLTTYGTLRNDAAAFAGVRFDTCVLDESQAAKNAATETAKAVRVVRADHRLALSGTPVENHLGELWTLFDFLNPGMLGRAVPTGGSGSARNPDPETREFLAKALRPYILRRTKAQVAKDLPEKTEQTVYCDLEPAQRRLYDELRDHYRRSLLSRVDEVGLARSKIQVLEALLRLRQAACHPGLIDPKRADERSAKLDVLLPQLRELAEGGSKVLVFSQFTSLLAIVRSRLDAEGVVYEYLDGRTRDRAERVERFQTDPACRLFLVSLKAGGVGLNLTAAEYVFLLDPWWNPAVEAQAVDRAHRIGQTKPVFAYRLIARGTVEEKVLALQQSKRELADAILGGDGRLITDLKREDLELLLS